MLLVLRHAESQWNVPPKRCQGQLDISLSDAGRAATAATGARLPLPDAAWSSHLSRAKETAGLLLGGAAQRDGLSSPPLTTDERLAEAFCGVWQGIPHAEIREQWPDEWAALGREDIMIVVGGVVPPKDHQVLRDRGVAAIFGPGSRITEAAATVVEELERRLGLTGG